MPYVDVFGKYYSFDKLPQDNKYYPLKKDNYERVKESYRAGDVEPPTFPIRAVLQTTEYCNLNCIMCRIHSKKHGGKLRYMKKTDFDVIAERLFPYLVEVHPTNIGEPLMSDWFGYFCDKVAEYGILLDVTTNGMLLDEEKIYKILPNLLDIKISFDGFRKETFERVRKNADFERINGNIDNLLRIREKEMSRGTVTLQMTLFNFNYTELLDIIKFADGKGIDKVKAYHVFSYSEEIDRYSPVNDLDAFEDTRVSAISLADELGVGLEISEPDSKDSGTSGLIFQKCWLPWSECWIDCDGETLPCHSHGGVCFGNVCSADFRSVWNGDNARKLRESLMRSGMKCMCMKEGRDCGMNFIKRDENQPVPYDKSGYLYDSGAAGEPVKWSGRSKQFQPRI